MILSVVVVYKTLPDLWMNQEKREEECTRRMRKKKERNLGWLNVMLIASLHIYYDAFVSANQQSTTVATVMLYKSYYLLSELIAYLRV